MSQQKDTDPEEYKRLHSEREAHLKRIQQLVEETSRLKAEASRLKQFSTSLDTPKFHWQKTSFHACLGYFMHVAFIFLCAGTVAL